MCNNKLEDFIVSAAARNRITFGDVRRLRRDYLPNGLSRCEDAEMLIGLDGKVGRIDRAWTDWLVATVVDFALLNDEPIDESGRTARDWLKAFLATNGLSTKATRRIAREVRSEAEPTSPVTEMEPAAPVTARPAKKASRKTTAATARPVVADAASDADDAPRFAAYVSFDCRNLAGSFARTVPQPYFHPIM